MKTLIAAAALLAVGATTASAQFAPHRRDHHPYEARHHSECQYKAQRLRDFERRALRDGRFDRQERHVIHELQRDIARTCGGYRHRG